jgi:hypothetical protein
MVGWYEAAAQDRSRRSPASELLEAARVGGRLTKYHARGQFDRFTHNSRLDDFNAQPVAAGAVTSRRSVAASAADPLVYLAGAAWDAVAGTDRQLATALAERVPVIWVDPSRSLLQRLRTGARVQAVSQPLQNLTRLSVEVVPGNSRAGAREVANAMVVRALRQHLEATGTQPGAVIASTTEPMLAALGQDVPGQRIYFATDDFVAAAGLWGRSPDRLHHSRERNLASADLVLAVTPGLAASLQRDDKKPVWFPNGADLNRYSAIESVTPSPEVLLSRPVAGLVGQVNDRLDLSYLEAVVEADVSLLIVGPAGFRDPSLAERFQRLVVNANVQWVGMVPPERLPALLRSIQVGLTPYADTEFNRHSYPLKTVEYLAAGVPVVSTSVLPMDGLDRRFVATAGTPASFAAAVLNTIGQSFSRSAVQASVQSFGWGSRADRLLDLIAAAEDG